MQKVLLTLMGLIFLQGTNVFANNTEHVEKRLKDHSADLERLKLAKVPMEKTINKQVIRIESAKSQMDQAKQKWRDSAGGLSQGWFEGLFEEDGDPQMKVAHEQAKKAQASLETEREKLKKYQLELRKAERKIEQTDTLIDTLEHDNKQRITWLVYALRSQRLSSDFNKLENQFFRMEDTLDKMEEIYDNALIGAYLQDKIGQLLNSNVICEARSRCATKDTKKISAEIIQKELFPKGKWRRKGYYEKVQRRRDGDGDGDK